MHHFYRPKHRSNSLFRDQKSNKHIANGYKKLVRAFKCDRCTILVDNAGTGCRGDGVPGSMEKTVVLASVEKTGSVVFVTSAHDKRSHVFRSHQRTKDNQFSGSLDTTMICQVRHHHLYYLYTINTSGRK